MTTTTNHTNPIAEPRLPALSTSPLARGTCVRCRTRIRFLHVRLCEDCLDARAAEGSRP
jgi:hypothetical protein